MSQYLTTARPHAKAIFEHALKQDQLHLWLDTLLVLQVLCQSKDFTQRARDPDLSTEAVLSFMLSCVKSCVKDDYEHIQATLRSYLQLLIGSDRLAISGDVYRLYLDMLSEMERTRHVDVISAHELSDMQLSTIEKALEGQFGCRVSITCFQDADLVGGVKLISGSWVLDGTIQNRLNNLRDSLRNLM